MLKQKILPALALCAKYSGANNLLAKKYAGQGVILMMHRLHGKEEGIIYRGGTLTTSFLKNCCRKSKRKISTLFHFRVSQIDSLKIIRNVSYV